VTESLSQSPYKYRARVLLHSPAEPLREHVTAYEGMLERVSDDRCILQTGARSLEALALFVAMLGVDFEVIEPEELVGAGIADPFEAHSMCATSPGSDVLLRSSCHGFHLQRSKNGEPSWRRGARNSQASDDGLGRDAHRDSDEAQMNRRQGQPLVPFAAITAAVRHRPDAWHQQHLSRPVVAEQALRSAHQA
jgi:hypothetical protein